MRAVFADTSYWIASFSNKDQWADAAQAARKQIGKALVITTEEVLVEFINEFAGAGPRARSRVIQFVENLLSRPRVEVITQSHQSFLDGLRLYQARPDKGYSLTDCISMNTMRERGIKAALTADRHFSQEGFTILMESRLT